MRIASVEAISGGKNMRIENIKTKITEVTLTLTAEEAEEYVELINETSCASRKKAFPHLKQWAVSEVCQHDILEEISLALRSAFGEFEYVTLPKSEGDEYGDEVRDE